MKRLDAASCGWGERPRAVLQATQYSTAAVGQGPHAVEEAGPASVRRHEAAKSGRA